MESQNQWIPVEERLPEDEITDRSDSDIVLAYSDTVYEIMYRTFIKDGDGYYDWVNIFGEICSPTHWMELPESPKIKQP